MWKREREDKLVPFEASTGLPLCSRIVERRTTNGGEREYAAVPGARCVAPNYNVQCVFLSPLCSNANTVTLMRSPRVTNTSEFPYPHCAALPLIFFLAHRYSLSLSACTQRAMAFNISRAHAGMHEIYDSVKSIDENRDESPKNILIYIYKKKEKKNYFYRFNYINMRRISIECFFFFIEISRNRDNRIIIIIII